MYRYLHGRNLKYSPRQKVGFVLIDFVFHRTTKFLSHVGENLSKIQHSVAILTNCEGPYVSPLVFVSAQATSFQMLEIVSESACVT